MKKVKVLFIALTLGLAFALSGCSEEIITPTDGPGTQEHNDPDA